MNGKVLFFASSEPGCSGAPEGEDTARAERPDSLASDLRQLFEAYGEGAAVPQEMTELADRLGAFHPESAADDDAGPDRPDGG